LSQKPYVIVPHQFDLLTISAPSFNPTEHRHVTASQRDKLLKEGDIELLDGPALIWRYTERKAATRGLSCKVGEYLAGAICSRQDWALVMRDEIRA